MVDGKDKKEKKKKGLFQFQAHRYIHISIRTCAYLETPDARCKLTNIYIPLKYSFIDTYTQFNETFNIPGTTALVPNDK